MTKATHTPGPWQVGSKHSDNGVWTPDGTLVALTHSSSRNYNRDEQIAEQNANARLIAAAPDLLEAFKAAMESAVWRHTTDCICEVCTHCRAAIAKAEGTDTDITMGR